MQQSLLQGYNYIKNTIEEMTIYLQWTCWINKANKLIDYNDNISIKKLKKMKYILKIEL